MGSQTMPNESMYYETLSSIPSLISELLEHYSGIKKDNQLDHVLTVRNRAYATHRYPCLGRFRFLELDLSTHPLYYSYVVPTLQGSNTDNETPPIFLDLGTCLGQDLRKLIFDGAPVSQLYGSDIQQDFIDAGYELFRDEDKFPRDRFLCPANVFDDPSDNKFRDLVGKVDILHATAVFHLFNKEQQLDVARCCMRLLRKNSQRDRLVLGAQAGNISPRETSRMDGERRFRHNEETWKALWEQVCQEEEFKDKVKTLQVKAQMETWTPTVGPGQQKHIGSLEEGFRWLRFEVWIGFRD